jgi:hypothetical protein
MIDDNLAMKAGLKMDPRLREDDSIAKLQYWAWANFL